MKKHTFDLSEKSRGYAEARIAGNGSWVEIEAHEFTRTGYTRQKIVLRLDLFSAACVAQKITQAVGAARQSLDRIERLTRNEGY
jgi:hypothetical protein